MVLDNRVVLNMDLMILVEIYGSIKAVALIDALSLSNMD